MAERYARLSDDGTTVLNVEMWEPQDAPEGLVRMSDHLGGAWGPRWKMHNGSPYNPKPTVECDDTLNVVTVTFSYPEGVPVPDQFVLAGEVVPEDATVVAVPPTVTLDIV